MTGNKGRAAATANSDYPAKENLHKQDSITYTQQMQERFSHINDIILRNIFRSNVLFPDVNEMQKVMDKCFGIDEKEFWISINYLARNGYVVQLANGIPVLSGGNQVKPTAQGIHLWAEMIYDDKVNVWGTQKPYKTHKRIDMKRYGGNPLDVFKWATGKFKRVYGRMTR